MSGEPAAIMLTAEPDTVLARAIDALGRFPQGHPWVLIGGVAVFLRLGSVTRPTADADAIARSQADLLRWLDDDEVTTVISGGEVRMTVGEGTVDIDVMDLADDPLPDDVDRRPFALARRGAILTAGIERVIVHDRDGAALAESVIPVATGGALVALKAVAMVRRPHGNHPEKLGSDIHDLVRLTAGLGALAIAGEVAALGVELAGWVAAHVERSFAGPDLRYTLLRLRRLDRSAGAMALTDDDVAATAILADAIRQAIDEGIR